jgi:general secretion pathway protein I
MKRGFTLLETMIAMMIMTGALIIIGQSWSGNLMRLEKSRLNTDMAQLLDRKMAEIEMTYRGEPISEIREEDDGDFGALFPGYTWEMAAKEFEMPDLSGALMSKDGGVDEMTLLIIRTVAAYLKETIKEVSVTVSFQPKDARAKPIRQSVATYFVDYTKPLTLAGGSASTGSSEPAGGPPQ